ncbi:hypothetical protein V8F20_012184 [Naviculisporaceae sp. PSN 640]
MAHFGEYWKPAFIFNLVWIFVAGIFVFARLVTRYYLGPDRLGYDDWILLAAWITNAIGRAITMASFYPLVQGMDMWVYYMSPDLALHFGAEMIFGVGLFFGWIEEALVRAAVVAFLYRLATNKWHKRILLMVVIPTVLFSLGLAMLYINFFYNYASSPFTPSPSHQVLIPTNIFFGWGIVVDFFLALFPWYMFHNVNMKPSRKYLICASLSLTAIAAGCAIYKFYGQLIWKPGVDVMYGHIITSFERGIFYICVSVPALLPLWTRFQEKRRRKLAGLPSSPGRQGLGDVENQVQILTVGGAGEDKKRKGGDGVINDPRLEALLIETAASGKTGTSTTWSRTGVEEKNTVDEKDIQVPLQKSVGTDGETTA